jgi:hypothetical protein
MFLPAFLRAPLDHIHSHDVENHPHGGFFHSHLPHAAAESSGPAWHDYDPDEDAQALDWFHPVTSPGWIFAAILSAVADFDPPAVAERTPSAAEPRAHDPPAFTPSSPRSPPA